jgi:segregation and condensation protein A
VETVNFKLQVFEGPLDLMLSLIAKHKLNIRDIEIAVLLEQFLAYIELAQDNNFELAGEFLEAAAHLLYIKTAALLPKHEADKLKRELEGVLIEYALCKLTAERLRADYIGDTLFTRKPARVEIDLTYTIGHHPSELLDALSVMTDRDKLKALLAVPPTQEQINPAIAVDYVSIFSKVIHVLKRLRKGERVMVRDLFESADKEVPVCRSAQVATFMALLELVSLGRIAFSDDLDYIKLAMTNRRQVRSES